MATSGCEDASDEYLVWICKICDSDGVTKKATAYCKNCESYFCGPCQKTHYDKYRFHRVFGEGERQNWTSPQIDEICCKIHANQKLSLFCGHHDTLCCQLCGVRNHSSDECQSTLVAINNVAKAEETKQEFNQIKGDISMLLQNLSTIEYDKSSYQSHVSASHDDCKRSVEEYEQTIIRNIKTKKEKTLTQLSECFKKEMDEISSDLKNISKVFQELNTFCLQLDRLLDTNLEGAFILMKQLKKKIAAYKSQAKTISDKRKCMFRFIKYKLHPLCTSENALGETKDVSETSEDAVEEETMSSNETRPLPGESVKCVVEIKEGSIIDYEADVIVTSVRKDLSLKEAKTSNVIYRAAGKEMQDELYASYPSGIDFWKVVSTAPHGLKQKKCKMVLLGLLYAYTSRDSLNRLEEMVKMCLTMASDNGHDSIAFPALGIGALSYPKSDVAKAMFEGVKKYIIEPRENYIKKVLFVIYDKTAKQAFQEARKDYPQFAQNFF